MQTFHCLAGGGRTMWRRVHDGDGPGGPPSGGPTPVCLPWGQALPRPVGSRAVAWELFGRWRW